MSETRTLRDIARESMGVYATDPTYVDTIDGMTVLAMGLGYQASAGTGGAYADLAVSVEHAEIIRSAMVTVDEA